MKHIIKIILPLILISLFIPISVSKADYGVTVGETYDYDIVKLEWEFNIGTESASGQGFTIDAQHFNQGSKVSVEVDSVSSMHVDWTVSINSAEEVGYSFFMDYTVFMPLYPLYGFVILNFVGSLWNQTAMDEGPGLITLVPFLWVDTATWQAMVDAVNPTILGSVTEDPGLENLVVDGKYEESQGIVIAETVVSGRADEPTGDDYFIIQSNFKCAYDKSTGVMLGMRIKTSSEGYFEEENFDLALDSHTEVVDYNLPDFTFDTGDDGDGSGFIPGFEWSIAVGGIGTLTMIGIIVKKFKK